MKYSDLTKTQQRCVDAFVKFRPELSTATSITRAEVEEIFHALYDARNSGGDKIAYPMWLVKGEKVSRGVYVFPSPNAMTKPIKETSSTRLRPEEDEEFYAELRANGIEI